MPAKEQPGNKLLAEWGLGESGWKEGWDANLRFLSAAVQLVLDRADGTLPADPQPGALAVQGAVIVGYHDGGWVTVATPKAGWVAYDLHTDKYVTFGAGAWATVGWIEDAPADGRRYIRKDNAWVQDDYRISASIPQITSGSQELGGFIIPIPMRLPQTLEGCVARCRVAPPSDFVLSIRKNQTDIGTITFLADQTNGVVDLTGTSDVLFGQYEELNIYGPSNVNEGVPEGIKLLFRLEM